MFLPPRPRSPSSHAQLSCVCEEKLTSLPRYVEPTIELDLYCEKPFALSPALASMNFISLSRDPLRAGPGLVEEDSVHMLRDLYTGGEHRQQGKPTG